MDAVFSNTSSKTNSGMLSLNDSNQEHMIQTQLRSVLESDPDTVRVKSFADFVVAKNSQK